MTEEEIEDLRDRARLLCTEPAQGDGWRQAFELGYIIGHRDAQRDQPRPGLAQRVHESG
jgi:hypothetical protein